MLLPWIVTLLVTFSESITFTNQPRLESFDGNIDLIAAKDKNLTLTTSGKGRITINGDDIHGVIDEARDAARTVASKGSLLSFIQKDVQSILSEGKAINQRLAACEAIYSNIKNASLLGLSGSKSTPSYDLVMAQSLKIRVDSIERDLFRSQCRLRRPCRNGGRCVDRFLDYLCLCPPGWEGKRCNRDVNECTEFSKTDLGCQNGATCVNLPGSYSCRCATGFYGKHCTKRTNDCSSGSSTDFCDHGVCINQAGGKSSYKCICDQGWTKAAGGEICSEDVDECLVAPCSRAPKVNCINIPGSFRCESCPAGYNGNGHMCEDVNECTANNGGCSTSPIVPCMNTIGSFRCGACPPGYSGDGRTCNYVGKCNVDHGGCHPQATCLEMGPNVVCTCIPGYSGTGVGMHGCIATGLRVTSTSPCSSNPCINGRCTETSATNYTCRCYMGYSGTFCQFPPSPCNSSPCANGGTCITSGATFRCRCTTLFTGPLCNDQRQTCGGYLPADDGTLEFPGSGITRYRPNLTCAWRIKVNDSMVIQANFDFFELQPSRPSGECFSDWLQVYDGKEVGHHNLIGKFCGNELPNNGSIVSTNNNLFLWFRSDRSYNYKGFKLRWNVTAPKCGGVIDARVHGSFSSPGAPGPYPKNRDCYWTFSTYLGQRITFTFFQLSLENHHNCNYDYLEFLDEASNGPLISRYCTSGNPVPLVAPGSIVVVHFHSDNASSDKGFQIGYHPTPGIPGCGGMLTAKKGEIRPAIKDDSYMDNLDCVWLIRGLPDTKIKLTVESIDIEKHILSGCIHDALEVRYGSTADAPLHGRFCGSDVPAPMTSPGNTMFVRFRTDRSVSHSGFRLTYEQVCSKTFTAPSGILTSPNFPNEYPQLVDCYYSISQPLGKAIRLDFQEFVVQPTTSICHDYLQIHDGYNIEAPTLIKACGTNRPKQVISTHNQLFLWFHTDFNDAFKGWAANYTTFDISCGGVLTSSSSGKISSPNHLDGYPPDITCLWVIHAPSGHRIQLNFASFHLEDSHSCGYDNVAVYDNRTDHELLGQFCGSKIPPPLTSSGNIVTIKFETDSSRTADGFQLQYNSLEASKVCGGNYFQSYGRLTSPNFPQDYPGDKHCVWVIKVPDGQRVRLQTETFSMESSILCNADRLEIRNGPTEISQLLGVYCGGIRPPSTILSMSSFLFLKFITDSTTEAKGFAMKWDSLISGCGGPIVASSGSIQSPNYPEDYPSNIECFYKIRTSAGSKIQVLIMDIDMEDAESCDNDYIQIFDGPDKNSKTLGKFCGNVDGAPPLLSSSNQMYIKFRSDRLLEARGFHLRYKTVCNVDLSGPRGVIESLDYPEPFQEIRNCSWSITVSPGHSVNLTFAHVDFTEGVPMNNHDLAFPYSSNLEIIDCSGRTPIEMGRIGGYNSSSKTFSSSGEKVCLNMYHKLLVQGIFRLEWVENGCGGRLTKLTDSFSFPSEDFNETANFSNMVCNWEILVDSNKAIVLTISDINILSPSCSKENLTVYGGADETSPILTAICTPHTPMTLQSSGNTLLISFKTQSYNSRKRFAATYTTVPSVECGGVFTAVSGFLHSAKTNLYRNCFWTIQSDFQHRVQIRFTDFDLANNANCSTTYIEMSPISVRNGISLQSPGMFHICSRHPPNGTFISTGNVLTVHLSTAPNSNALGFQAEYFWVCGATVTINESGIFTPRAQQDNTCSITFLAPQADGHVALSVFWQAHGSGAFVEIFDGEDENSTLLGKVGNEDLKLPFTSTGNVITAKTNFPQQLSGHIEISYSAVSSACGGVLKGFSGQLASPNFPRSYPVNVECIWQIPTTIGSKIQLSFKNFELQESDSCNLDYLEIRNGSAEGTVLHTYCSTNSPATLTSDGGFWIKFSSNDDGIVANGFLVEFSWVYTNEISGSSGAIANPFYPNSMVKQCVFPFTWKIIADAGKKIHITFTDFSNDPECSFFNFQIYDGYDTNAAFVKQYCGFTTPPPFVSSSNAVFISVTGLKMDDAFFKDGIKFYINWKQVDRVIPRIPSKKLNPSIGCGDEIYMSRSNVSIVIQSPDYPKPYPLNTRCTWIVRAPPGYHLGYRMVQIHLKEYPNCLFDSISVYNGEKLGFNDKPMNKYCLQNETHGRWSLVEVGDVLTMVFSSSFLRTNHNTAGFSAIVTLMPGGTLLASDGVIEYNSTTSVRSRISSEFYYWRIRVGRGRKVKATFEEFTVAANSAGTCADKYVMLRNGFHPDSPLLGKGKYCGKLPANIPITTSDELYVKVPRFFKGLSFKLRFREVRYTCGGRLELSEDTKYIDFSTPNYPNSPPPKLECLWLVTAPVDKTIQISFIQRFDLYNSDSCDVEYVEIRDGASSAAGQLGKFCSDQLPSSLTSSDHMLYIKYYTNATDPNNGFKATVSIDHCGGVIRARNGIVSTNGYPHLPTEQLNCTWTISTDPREALLIQFSDFNLPTPKRVDLFQNTPLDEHWDIAAEFYSLQNFVVVYEEAFEEDNIWRFVHRNRTRHTLLGNRVITPHFLGMFYEGHPPVPISSSRSTVFVTLFSDVAPNTNFRGFKLNFTSEVSECYQEVFVADGIITSPHYVKGQNMPNDCRWLIRVNPERRITVSFEYFDFSGENMDQIVSLLDGETFISRIDFFTKDKPPLGEYKSSGNTMLVHFYSRGVLRPSFRGFKLKFSSQEAAACGGILNVTKGILEPPKNLKSFDCRWKFPVNAEINYSQIFFLENANLGNQSRICQYRHSSGLFIESDKGNEFTHALCGTIPNSVIGIPDGNILVSAMQSDQESTPVKFRMKYKRSNCGGVISSNMLPYTLTSPNYPELYDSDTDCAWRVSNSIGQTLKVTFVEFQLELTSRDYLEIRSGPTFQSPLIDTYRGVSSTVKTLVSVGESLYVAFHTLTANRGKGFKLVIENNHTECGGLIQVTSSVEITSPNYPGKYENNMECEWEIRTVFGYHIALSFPERFQLEQSEGCVNDSIQIIDPSATASLPTNVCGRYSSGSYNYNSTENRLMVRFRSNEAIVGDGFKARLESKCGAVLNASSGTITSPNFPHFYQNNVDCEFRIFSQSERILLNFTHFDLEPPRGSNCAYDYVAIYIYDKPPSLIRRLCGQKADLISLNVANGIIVKFHSDSSNTFRGFELKYSVQQCGGQVLNPTLLEYSLAGVNHNVECTWFIKAPPDMIVSVLFTQVALSWIEWDACSYGILMVKDPALNSTTTAIVCGIKDQPIPLLSTTNELVLTLKIGSLRSQDASFKAVVTFSYGVKHGCGGNLRITDKPQILNSPDWNHDGRYEEFLDCTWVIEAPESHYLTAKFLSLNVDSCNSTDCSCDFVEIRDGIGPLSNVIEKVCGSSLPEQITSSSNMVWIRFSTDGSYSGSGFKIEISSLASPCREQRLIANEELKQFTSPGYPEPYPNSVRCTWRIFSELPPNATYNGYVLRWVPHIHIQIKSWDLESSTDCSNDYISIEMLQRGNGQFAPQYLETASENVPFIYSGTEKKVYSYFIHRTPTGKSKYCGSGHSVDFFAPSGVATVQFVSNSAVTGGGFTIEYSTRVCGRHYSGVQGRIRIEHFLSNQTCFVSVQAPSENHTISLYFSYFYIRNDKRNCDITYLKVKDGADSSASEILRACGYSRPSPVFSSGQNLYLEFRSKSILDEVDITYTTTDQGKGCGGEIFNYAGFFTSPFYPNKVESPGVCQWLIIVPEGLQISMKFTAFDIQSSTNCTNDFIELFDTDENGASLTLNTKFCGGDDPGTVQGSGNVMVVKYTRSTNNNGTGWSIKFAGFAPGYGFAD